MSKKKKVNRPDWCPDQECEPLGCSRGLPDHGDNMDLLGKRPEHANSVYQSCIGKLAQPVMHGSVDDDLSLCIPNHGVHRYYCNQRDFALDVIIIADCLKKVGQPLPHWVIDRIDTRMVWCNLHAEGTRDPGHR